MISTATRLSGIVEDVDISKIAESEFLLRNATEDNVKELSRSIVEHGLINPIVVRVKDELKYEIVAGNRRYTACKNLGYKKMACHVIELDDKGAFEISLIENIQRHCVSLKKDRRSTNISLNLDGVVLVNFL